MISDENREQLLDIVRAGIAEYGEPMTMTLITAANMGRPDGRFVNEDNMGLFRQYRNSVGAALILVAEAQGLEVPR